MNFINKEPDFSDLQQAAERISPFINRTPVLSSTSVNRLLHASLFFKCENFQKVGAFKFRGAANAIQSLSEDERKKGVATHSSGNHAQALSLAAKMAGCKAYIVMPENAPEVKKNAVKGYGAEIIPCKPTLASREETLDKVVKRTGAAFIHPYNDYRMIAGHASAVKELTEDTSDLDLIMAPVGGGGLLSGTLLGAHYLNPRAEVIAGEPKGADDAFRSMKTGKIIPSENPKTIADGLLTSLGEKTFNIMQKYLTDIVTVDEQEIIDAMRLVWERMKIIIEPSAAVALAAFIRIKEKYRDKRVGIILTGGNVDLNKLPF